MKFKKINSMRQLIRLSESYPSNSIHTIKLRNLLEMRDPLNELKQIRTLFPPIEVGSITLVDQITLLALIELVDPERILEIGTYQGYSTRLFLNNSNAQEIISVDLPEFSNEKEVAIDKERVLQDGDYNDDYLRLIQNKSGGKYLNGLSESERLRLKLIKCDSTKLDYKEEVGTIELAFVDGGHHFDIVTQDTYNVTNQIKSGVIVWHDYSSVIHSDVTKFLAEHSKKNQVFYVSGSLCAFQIIGDCANV